MNICIVCGKIISDISFDFLYNNPNNISIASCKLILRNKSVLEIFGYDEMADYMYRDLEIDKTISVTGRLVSQKNEIKLYIIDIEKNE